MSTDLSLDEIKKFWLHKANARMVNLIVSKIIGTDNFDVTLIRDKIPINSVMSSFLYNETTGYINVNRFKDKTFKEVESSIDSLTKFGMKELILDLRGNPGGYMHEALYLLDSFISDEFLDLFSKKISNPLLLGKWGIFVPCEF